MSIIAGYAMGEDLLLVYADVYIYSTYTNFLIEREENSDTDELLNCYLRMKKVAETFQI
jgi:hypothetical protein